LHIAKNQSNRQILISDYQLQILLVLIKTLLIDNTIYFNLFLKKYNHNLNISHQLQAMSHTPRFTSFMTEIPSFATSTANYTITPSQISSTPLKTPSLTWEQFVLLNVELDRLSTLCKTLASEN